MAAVGGLATAGVIIVRNAVGGAGDQVDDDSRNERLDQREVNVVLRTSNVNEPAGTQDKDITFRDARTRCNLDYQQSDGTYPLRKWRGSFTLKFVQETTNPTSPTAGTGDTQIDNSTDDKHWCDAVPTNNLPNNPANFAEPIRINYGKDVCVRWPGHDNYAPFTDGGGAKPETNENCSMS